MLLAMPAYCTFSSCPRMSTDANTAMLAMATYHEAKRWQESGSHGNTSLVFHAQKLMALEEGGLPYQLRTACAALLDTIGQVSFGGKLQHAFTAHPKVDADSKYMFSFGYSVESKPYCMRSVYDPAGMQGCVATALCCAFATCGRGCLRFGPHGLLRLCTCRKPYHRSSC